MNIGERLFPLVEDMLDWTAKRQQALSANLANMDTPGYRAKDVAFSEAMRSAALAKTSEDHLTPTDKPGMKVFEVDSEVKKNGNSVDIDREMTELTKNGLQYVALVQYLNAKLRTLRTAVNDGGRS